MERSFIMIKSNAKWCSNEMRVICNVFFNGIKFALQWSTFSSISWRLKVINDGCKLIWGYDPPRPFSDLIDGGRDVSKTRVTLAHGSCVCCPLFELLVSEALKPRRLVWMCRREGGKARPTCRRWRWGLEVTHSYLRVRFLLRLKGNVHTHRGTYGMVRNS